MLAFYIKYYLPDTLDMLSRQVVVDVRCGRGSVRITPALVPIHNKSLQASRAVALKQAALCCRIISSQPISKYWK